jgi:hypothetical protein
MYEAVSEANWRERRATAGRKPNTLPGTAEAMISHDRPAASATKKQDYL